MRHTKGHFTGAEGLELFYQGWAPEAPPRGVVALVHGVGEHSGRYMNLVAPLVDRGYAVYGYDQRGHGASPGPRVHVDRWSQYREDLRAYLSLIGERRSGLPLVLYGHSMGSLVVLDYLLEHPRGLAGAIVSGVALEPAGVGSPALVAAARVLTHVTPRLTLDLKIDPRQLTRDPDALEATLTDPWLTSRATVRWGTESLDTVARIKDAMHEIDLPLLVLHGGDDPLNLPEGARALVETAASSDKTLLVYPGVLHEPHNDLGHEKVAADVADWLDRVTDSSAWW